MIYFWHHNDAWWFGERPEECDEPLEDQYVSGPFASFDAAVDWYRTERSDTPTLVLVRN